MEEPAESGPGYIDSSSASVECPGCGKTFASVTSVKKHWYHGHKGESLPEGWARPTVVKREQGSSTRKAVSVDRPSSETLREDQRKLTESIIMIGAVIAGVLGTYKSFAITCQVTDTMVQIPPMLARGPLKGVKPFTPPYFETTFGHMVVDQAPFTAAIVMRYASDNPALLGWVRRLNGAVHMEGDAKVAANHLMAGVHTLRPQHGMARKWIEWQSESVMRQVSDENVQLQAKVEELQAQLVAQQSSTPRDERGSGN
jgi:hypothetical protein